MTTPEPGPVSPQPLPPEALPPEPAAPQSQLDADRDGLRDPRRVSPFGPLFLAWAVIRQIGFLNIGIFTAVVGSRNLQLLGFGGSLLLLLIGVLQWLRFTYGLESSDEGDQLVTLSGVFSRNRTSVPLDRIQSVSTRQNLMHRVFGLVEVNVQTAGSAGAEVQLSAVRPQVAEQIRRLSTNTATSGEKLDATAPVLDADGVPAPPVANEPVVRRSLGELLVVAFTRNPLVLLAPIPLAFGFASEAEGIVDWLNDRFGATFEQFSGSVLAAVGAAIFVLFLSALVSVAFVVFRLYDLRLFVDGPGLRRLSGLLSRTEVSTSVERVQLIAVRDNVLERSLGIAELVLPVAGGTVNVQVGNALPSALQLPGTKPNEVATIADLVLGVDRHDEPGHESTTGISRLAVRRWTLWIGLVPAAVVTIALWFLIGWWALLVLAWPALIRALAPRWRRGWQWSLGPETLRISHGVVGRVRRDMPVRKMQNVTVDQGFFHRRHELADLKVRTASRVQMVIPFLPLDVARSLRDELLYRAESDPRPFM